MLAQRLRRWLNMNPILGQCIVLWAWKANTEVIIRLILWNINSEETRRPPNVGFMLAQRLRRWASIKPTLDGRLLSVGCTRGVHWFTERQNYGEGEGGGAVGGRQYLDRAVSTNIFFIHSAWCIQIQKTIYKYIQNTALAHRCWLDHSS